MYFTRWAILAVGVGAAFIASAKEPAGTVPRANIAAGREFYRQNCSTCHGMDAKGFRSNTAGLIYDPNSADESRRVPPSDLTVLRERNAGKFPADRVRDSVDGKITIPAHPTPDMPGWGQKLNNLKSNPKRLERTLRDLTGYIESIQEPKK